MSRNRILLVGEGNFSFGNILSQALESAADTDSGVYSSSSSLREKLSLLEEDYDAATATTTPTPHEFQIIATDCNKDFLHNPTNDPSRQKQINQIKENISLIKANGGIVLLDVDCTSLERHHYLFQHRDTIDKIIFNFPHVKRTKMHIGLNRNLLSNFFQSAGKFLKNAKSDVEVLVTLCSGQSGINEVEKKQRDWADSWQVIEQAALGSFILKRTESFPDFWVRISSGSKKQLELLYSSSGYRNRPSSFNYEDATTFTFVQRSPPTPNFIEISGISIAPLTSISDDSADWDDDTVQTQSQIKTNEYQNTLDPLSIDESLAFQMSSMYESINKENSPYHVFQFCSNFFVGDDDHAQLSLRLNFEDQVVSDFYSAVTVWIKSTKVAKTSSMFNKLRSFLGNISSDDVSFSKKDEICDYQHQKFEVSVKKIYIGDINFPIPNEDKGYWDLHLNNLLKLRLPLGTDMQCIFSEYSDMNNFTHSLYPRTFFYETSLWAKGPHLCPSTKCLNEETDPIQIFKNITKVAVLVYGPLLKEIDKIPGEEFTKKEDKSFGKCLNCGQYFTKIAYNYCLELQSIDKPFSRKVANSFNDAFRSAIKTFLVEVEVR
ncbi:uncharacterized protein LOC118434532 [Folsomia candida]|uniref:Ferredoxin-fold anticodon-binding domain-containing protein 1 n=1 Tax=Folsomia candida TaxID=158441 RepID=A0A226EQK4_FOLCA|nr:uncharacterized protein LOC118434532 [Folsomia candida]OXA59903.1 Ferredoxin-fold anticodon-binding domain-containing protein 1 [Folsomia candida]